MLKRPGIISLFCGPGGLDQGFKDAGFTTQLAYDNDKSCIDTHQHNHPDAKAIKADLTKLDVSNIIDEWNQRSDSPPSGLVGGVPCQSFSFGNAFQTEFDPRHQLSVHYARILRGLNKAFNLDFFLFENVPGLLSNNHIDKFKKFKILFRRAGFNDFVATLDAQHFGVSQVRPRVFIVGINRQKYPEFQFKFPSGCDEVIKNVWDAIGMLPDPIFFQRGLDADAIPYHPNHWCMVPKSRKFADGSLKLGQNIGRSFRVLAWDKPSYTVAYGHMEVHIHPNCKRRLSMLEAMLLQGFSSNYVLKGSLTAQTRLISEAVPPPVAFAIGQSLINQLGFR